MKINKFKKASISLTTVIIIGGILIMVGIALISASLDNVTITSSFNNLKMAQINGMTCIEEAMSKIKSNSSFTGNAQINLNSINCSYTISNDLINNQIKIISINSIYGNTQYSVSKKVDLSKTPLDLTNY